MQKLQDSVFSIVKTTNLSPAVFSYLQPTEDFTDKTPLGGILSDTKHGWLALGPKFCVVDLRTGLKVAARTFGESLSNFRTTVTCVVELPAPLTNHSQQLIISLECEDISGMICVFHINGSQILRCIQTQVVVTELAVSDGLPDGPFTCFDGIVMAGTKTGEIFVFDLNRASLIQALKDISQGYEHVVRSEENSANITFLPLTAVQQIDVQRELTLENDDHIAVLLNETSLVEGQYIFRNPDGTVRMKAKRDHIRVTVLQYIPQLGSIAVGFNFGAFQIWNLLNLDLVFTSQVNVECLPVTHFGFQEPCDDPRAFCYLWVVFSVMDRFDEEEFPLAVMYSLTYQGKRMLSDTKCLYQEFLTATIRFQVELSNTEEDAQLIGGRCVSCHTYSVNSSLGAEGEDSMLNICQLVWECWGENANSSAQYGMLLFDLDQWYKDQMPATYQLQSNAFMSATCCTELARGACVTLDVRLAPASVSAYSAATRLEEHFYPNSLHYNCICLNTSEACVLSTIGIQRQIINSMDQIGPTALLNPTRLYNACVATGLVPLCLDSHTIANQEEQRRYLLSVALEARLSRFLKRCAHDWATGSHSGAGCTLTFLVDWCWKRAIELKENARELTSPLFTSSALPDRNVVRCLEHCVQQLTQLTGLLDAVLTKCCNLLVPDALSEMEEKHRGIGTVSLYFQVVQWFLRCGLLPERSDACAALPYPGVHLANTYSKRRLKLQRVRDHSLSDDGVGKSCPLLYIDQLLEQEFGGDRIHELWIRGGSECHGLYPPPSLYSLLRLYLMPDIPEEHKHSLVLYLLVDYSMVYDEVRYETVIRRLMQFPTMFGLSNTAIKATQAFWHLDHRDFDFALDQLQCLTGNTLSEWQHNVVLSSLLAQKKTQAALQYLHVRKPAPIQNISKEDMASSNNRVNDHDKLEDWQSCCNLYLARGLVFEALDVIRMCVQNAGGTEDKGYVLNFFFKGCRNTGHLSKILQITLLPFEEDVFIRYLENCNESQTSDILIMYYLQQARYLEAEQYNTKLKHAKTRSKDLSTSIESLLDVMDRESARDTLVEVVCSSLPSITNTVAHYAFERDVESHIIAAKPLSVFVQAKSPKNTFTYKSSFIQDTIDNASETWINKPRTRRGLKRALNIEETPFICTPKLTRTKSIFTESASESTPAKRPRFDLSGTPKTPMGSAYKAGEKLSRQMAALLEMPETPSPDTKLYERSGAETPHSILKIRGSEGLLNREAPSPADSRYLDESDDEMLETASNHTHYSDSTNKHLRFTIPTASESGSTPSPPAAAPLAPAHGRRDAAESAQRDVDISVESFVTTTESHGMNEPNSFESPPKKLATEENVKSRKQFKDSVRARRSLSISANSSLSEDPNTSIESIADIPITLINPRYSGKKSHTYAETKDTDLERGTETKEKFEKDATLSEAPKMPRGRRGIRESTPLINRSRSATPERQDSPIASMRPTEIARSRSRSRTPDVSPRSSPLACIPEQPQQETESRPHPTHTTLRIPRQLRSRSRTPERVEKVVESPRLESITESPVKCEPPATSPARRSLRSRSRTPEVETPPVQLLRQASPRSLRSRSKTPEKLMSPKKDPVKSAKKPLSRLVLESNAVKTILNLERAETDAGSVQKSQSMLECTPKKTLKAVSGLMDVTISPIACKSMLQSSNESVIIECDVKEKVDDSTSASKTSPAFTIDETRFGKSVLASFESSIETSHIQEHKETIEGEDPSPTSDNMKSLPAFTLSESYFGKSVLHSYQSSVNESSNIPDISEKAKEMGESQLKPPSESLNVTDFDKSVLGGYESSIDNLQSISESTAKDITTKDSQVATASECVYKDVSSLLTSDSDIDIKDDSHWRATMDKKDTALQKEKEKIVEIVREINEIEGMSDDEDESEDMGIDTDSDDEEIDEDEEGDVEGDVGGDEEGDLESDVEGDEEGDVEGDEESDVEGDVESDVEGDEACDVESDEEGDQSDRDTVGAAGNDSDDENKVISILDSDSDSGSSPSSDRLQIVEETTGKTQTESTGQENNSEVMVQVNIEKDGAEDEDENEVEEVMIETSADPLNQAQFSMMTDDNSMRESYQEPNEEEVKDSDETKGSGENDGVPMETDIQLAEPAVQIQITVGDEQEELAKETTPAPKDTDVVDAKSTFISPSLETEIISTKGSTNIELGSKVLEGSKAKSTIENKLNLSDDGKAKEEKSRIDTEESEKLVSQSGTHLQTTFSYKSTKEIESEIQTESTQEVPGTRKRSQSTAESEVKTPESGKNTKVTTPSSRSRAKTPTSTEVRKMLTRRASKELSEKLDNSEVIDESLMLTPKRRSTRSRSKNQDDNASVASGSSVRSLRSKASEDTGDIKLPLVRKGKKSILKPDLSVIPESAVEESVPKSVAKEDVINEYSSARRLTRHQKAVLESWLEPQASPRRRSATSRTSATSRASVTSRTTATSDHSREEDDASSTHSAFDVQPIDRISLMNKEDFEGSPDPSEAPSTISPESIASDASRLNRSRMARAASETKSTPKAAKIVRRTTVDIPDAPESPASAARSRRASFNRACEALHTPKGRRTSTKGETDSQQGSPAASEAEAGATPARRGRRASAQSNVSQSKADTSKRSKK